MAQTTSTDSAAPTTGFKASGFAHITSPVRDLSGNLLEIQATEGFEEIDAREPVAGNGDDFLPPLGDLSYE